MRKLFFPIMLMLAVLLVACSPSGKDYAASLRMQLWKMEDTTQEAIRDSGVLAAYYNEKQDYYCVSTYGRSVEDVVELEIHEACHALIKKEKEHFCNEVKQE